MKKYRHILLPDDERIKSLRKDPPEVKSIKQIRWYHHPLRYHLMFGTRLLFGIIITIPLIIISLLIALFAKIKAMRTHGDVNVIFSKDFDVFKNYIDKITPFEDFDLHRYRNLTPAVEPEDIPQFLSNAKKHAYRIIIYSFDPLVHTDERLISLKDAGTIHEIFYAKNEHALEELFRNDLVDQEHSHVIFTPGITKDPLEKKPDFILSSGAFRSVEPTTHRSFSKCGKRIMFSRIKLPFNRLLDETVVLYYETEHHPAWNDFIRENYAEIQQRLSKKGLRLLYFPALISDSADAASYQQLISYLYPDHRVGDVAIHLEHLQSWFSSMDVPEIYALLERQFSIPYSPVPSLIHCVELISEHHTKNKLEYSQIPLWSEDEAGMRQELDHYLDHVNFPDSRVFFSLAGRDEREYDADEEFPVDGLKVSEPLMARIRELRQLTPEAKMLSTLFHFIQSFRDMDPVLCRKLSAQLYDSYPALTSQQSRLYIDKQFRIFLPDFGNIEIEMTPLPKTLFLFMLKYPDGVLFKELYRHKQELIYIYGRIGNRSDPDQMLKSINDMTDARSNSVNEKSSRIKEAFLSKIDDRIAAEYYITGQRQEPKKIRLDRKLLQFEEPI